MRDSDVKRLITQMETTLSKPVAWLEPEWGEKICPEVGYEATITDDHPRDLCWIPLYPQPPKREWVGLTDEEITELRLETFDAWATNYEVYRAIEDALRSKNDNQQ